MENGMTHDWDLIIFDCDGVLIDSELLSAEVLIDLLAEAGVSIGFDHVRRNFLGRSFATVARHIREDLGHDLAPDFEHLYRTRLLARFETDLKPMPGIAPALALASARGLPVCVATSSSPPRVSRSLAIAGLAPALRHVFTASQVARGKPAPDLFLLAASEMGAAPARTLVIEDSLPGLEAAAAAGMTAVRFIGGGHLAKATLRHDPSVPLLRDWAGFPALLDQLRPEAAA
ncbi:HAD family hydrolase [Limimaricola sp.]|uniref:HAD family hydrolase n=1 Tax=Limimaricola sp. TaxID=2211665 RepID=UPI004059E3EC